MLKKEVEKLVAMSLADFAKLYYKREFIIEGRRMLIYGYWEAKDWLIMSYANGWALEPNLEPGMVMLGESQKGKYWFVGRHLVNKLLPTKGHIRASKYVKSKSTDLPE